VNAPPSICLGIDENGLGPRLGPLIVTAVTAEASETGRDVVRRRPRGAMRARLGDSKELVRHGDTALGEAWARALVRRTTSEEPDTPEALVQALSLDTPQALRSLCPKDHTGQCWDVGSEEFAAQTELVEQIARDLSTLEKKGIRVLAASCVVTCAQRLNQAASRGLTRFHTDLHAMERLVLDARHKVGRDVDATCGKVGGFDRYPPAFGPMSGYLHVATEEGRARSEYAIPTVGRVAFVRDADAQHVLVCMASLVGKWVRDLLTARVVRYYRVEDPELPDASGYHDPVTTRFIRATELVRARRGVPEDCFVRRACDYDFAREGREEQEEAVYSADGSRE
jgi:ribonuclease HII